MLGHLLPFHWQDKEYPAKALQIAKLKRQQEILASAFKVSAVHSCQLDCSQFPVFLNIHRR